MEGVVVQDAVRQGGLHGPGGPRDENDVPLRNPAFDLLVEPMDEGLVETNHARCVFPGRLITVPPGGVTGAGGPA